MNPIAPPPFEQIRSAILKSHNLRIDPTDPVLATVTMLDITIRHYAAIFDEAVKGSLARYDEQASVNRESAVALVEKAAEDARKLLNDTLRASQQILERDRAARLAEGDEKLKQRQEGLTKEIAALSSLVTTVKWCAGTAIALFILGVLLVAFAAFR